MGFRINRGIFKVLDSATNTYKEKFKIDGLTGAFVKLDDDGNAVADAITTDGGTITGAFHTTHTSNTYTGAHATLGDYYINDSQTRLHEGGGNSLRITTPSGWVQFGAENSSWAHFNTDRSAFYFNRGAAISGELRPYADNAYGLGNSTYKWSSIHGVTGNFTGNLVVGGTITAQEFHTEFVNQTIIQETGDVQVDGVLTFSGAATTTNQGYGIHWSGFDKEGTTDPSDSAHIVHTTSTGGFSGSVLRIQSMNDANDGIAFVTHASSPLRHNGHTILTGGNYGGTLNPIYKRKSDELISPRPQSDAVPTSFPSGLYVFDSESSAPYSWPFDAGIVWGIHPSVGSNYRHLQFISSASGDQLMMRMKNGTNDNWQGWNHLATRNWVTGSAKAADSNLLDGINSTSFLRSDTADTYGSTLTASGQGWYLWGLGGRGASAGAYGIGNGNDNAKRQLTFHVPNIAAYGSSGVTPSFGWYSNGSVELMKLYSDNGALWIKGNVDVGTKLLVNGANDNSGKADFAVGNSNQISWMSSQVQIGATDMNWGGKAYYSSGFHIGSWDVNLRLFNQGAAGNNRDIEIAPQRNGSPTEVTRFKGDGYQYFPGLEFAISTVNSDHGVANYFRGSNTHLVIGTGGTLYLNYGQSGGDTRMYGTIWHNDVNIGTPWGSGNDGAGSGLDADTVDGLQASSFIRSDAADSVSGQITFNAGITGFDSASEITGNNFNIRGVNEIFINDPGEGIVWQNGSSGNMQLAITDDSTDRVLNLSGTGASLAVNGAKVATESWVSGQISATSGITQSDADGRYWRQGGGWAADLVTTHGYVRQVGFNAAGGEFVLASINNKITGLLDGDYLAGERGGFYSLDSNNTFGSRKGFYNDGTYARFNAPLRMDNNAIHYVSDLHFNGNTRFVNQNSNYVEFRTGSTSHGGIRFTTNGSTRGYLYHNSSNEIGFLDTGGSWAIRHTNDSGTDFFTDGETREFSIGRDRVTGSYGTVQTHTTRSSWGGYSINGQYVFMSDHSTSVGIFNDIDNEWMILAKRNANVNLYHNGDEKLRTTSTGIQVTGHIVSSSKTTYSKGYASLDATGHAVAGLVTGYNGGSAMITFTCYGDSGQYQKIVYSCWNTSGTAWNVRKVVDEGTNVFDIEVDAVGATRTFTFTGRGGTRSYSPVVIVEHSGHSFDSSYL